MKIENIKTIIMLLAITGGLMIINIVLGSVNGAMKEKFDWKKFLFGVLKAIVNAICIVGTCCLCDIFAQVINTIDGIAISTEIVSTLEIIAVVVAWCLDLFKDVFEKIKSLKDMKYVAYDDVKVKYAKDVNEVV